MESLELKKFLKEVGDSVHSMNTIAVALSRLPSDSNEKPEGLEISWHPKDLNYSKLISRNYAERSSYVYATESLFEYLENISKNPLWIYQDINFKGDEKKAIKVYKFLRAIPDISESMALLSELLCHWRNRIVHLTVSNAGLSNNKITLLKTERDKIYSSLHHFDVYEALNNFTNKKITLKDASTLITNIIKCAKAIDNYFFEGISKKSFDKLKDDFMQDSSFRKIATQQPSSKKDRQLERWLSIHYPYLNDKKKIEVLRKIKSQ